jgi:hypothetical protein
MRWSKRLAKLEKIAAHCPRCGRRDDDDGIGVVHEFIEDPIGSPPRPLRDYPPPAPCPGCGRVPQVLQLVRQVARTCEEAQALLAAMKEQENL